jgi:hypothetical protein
VPNFILAFIPAQINRDTLNIMTAFAVRVCAQSLGPIRDALKGTYLRRCRRVDCYLMSFCTSYHIRFSENIKMGPYIS